jgi:MFS family permease
MHAADSSGSETTEDGPSAPTGDPNPALIDDHDPYAVLRFVDYRRFLFGGFVSTIGGQVQSVTVGWDLYERTGSATALGLIGLVQFVPILLIAMPAGHAADRYSRKYQIIVAHTIMAVAALGLLASSWLKAPTALTYACLLLSGIGQAIHRPARWALLPELVPKHLVPSAVTWNSSSWQFASIFGPALGGFVIRWSGGATAAYLLDAVCAAVVVGLLAPIRAPRKTGESEPLTVESILAGIRFVRRTELILATITLDLFAVLLGGATALLPIFARDILHVGPVGLGWLRAAPSMGACLMALLLAHRPPMRKAGPVLLASVAGFGVATIIFGLSRDPILSFAMLALTGALDSVSVVVRATLLQVLTPNTMRGRVSAVNAVFISSSNELGGFESGITAQLFGPVISVVGGGVGTIVIVLLAAIAWPQVRRLGSLHRAAELEVEDPQ